MSISAIDTSPISTEFIESEANPVLDSTVQQHNVWDGRKWAMLGSQNNLPPFLHNLCALTSSVFESSRWALQTLGSHTSAQGVLSHSRNLLEGIRDAIDYTGFINVIYQTAKSGPDFFVAKEASESGKEKVNLLKTASNASFVAIDLLFPVHFVLSRLKMANIAHSPNLEEARNFIQNGFPATQALTIAGGLWGVASGLSLANTISTVAQSVYKAVNEERNSNANYTTGDLVRAGWNKGATWSNLNKLQLSAVSFGFSALNGGILFPSPQGLVKMAALAFKGMAAFNAVTQTCIGEKIKA